MSDILERMRIICDESGLNDQEIAEKTEISRGAVHQLRTTAVGSNLEKIERIIYALGYDIFINRGKK